MHVRPLLLTPSSQLRSRPAPGSAVLTVSAVTAGSPSASWIANPSITAPSRSATSSASAAAELAGRLALADDVRERRRASGDPAARASRRAAGRAARAPTARSTAPSPRRPPRATARPAVRAARSRCRAPRARRSMLEVEAIVGELQRLRQQLVLGWNQYRTPGALVPARSATSLIRVFWTPRSEMTSAAAVRMAGRRKCAVDGRGLMASSPNGHSGNLLARPAGARPSSRASASQTSSRARSIGIAGSPSSARSAEPVEQGDHAVGDAVGVAGREVAGYPPRSPRRTSRACARRAGRRWGAVLSISSSPCAVETNNASNWDGAT